MRAVKQDEYTIYIVYHDTFRLKVALSGTALGAIRRFHSDRVWGIVISHEAPGLQYPRGACSPISEVEL